MQDRHSPLEIPDRPPYIVIDVPGHGDHHWRLPSPVAVQRLAEYQSTTEDGMAALGVTLGVCWRHRDLELASHISALGPMGPELDARGQAVIEELHEAGYALGTLHRLSRALWEAVNDSQGLAAAVEEHATFSTGEDGADSPSPVTSSTSAVGSAPSTP